MWKTTKKPSSENTRAVGNISRGAPENTRGRPRGKFCGGFNHRAPTFYQGPGEGDIAGEFNTQERRRCFSTEGTTGKHQGEKRW